MALVALLRGMNVGGHRRLRPAAVAEQLAHLEVVSIGAAGTFVARGAVTHARLRAALARRLPFDAAITIISGHKILRVLQDPRLANARPHGQSTRFVSVLARSPRQSAALPTFYPSRRSWLTRILARDGRLVIGEYRRDMKVIGCLGELDRLFGTMATTRGRNTLVAIGEALGAGPPAHSPRTRAT